MAPLVDIGLTDLPKSGSAGGAMAPQGQQACYIHTSKPNLICLQSFRQQLSKKFARGSTNLKVCPIFLRDEYLLPTHVHVCLKVFANNHVVPDVSV